MKETKYLKDYAEFRVVDYKDKVGNLLYQKVDCAFYNDYNEKRDSIPIKTLKLHSGKNGQYVIHNHNRFYLGEQL